MSHYTFNEPCSSCAAVPSYNGSGLCDACTMGPEHRNDWVDVMKEGGYIELTTKPLFLIEGA